MLEFIKKFLRHRYIQVRVNGQLSKKIELENGVPQGSVLSVTLFLISFNDVNNCFKYSVKSSKFANDITFYCKGKEPETIVKLIQKSLESLQEWSDAIGYQFSTTKSMCIPFAKTRSHDINPTLYLNSQKLKVVDTIKILGLLFNKRLTWKPHIKQLKDN